MQRNVHAFVACNIAMIRTALLLPQHKRGAFIGMNIGIPISISRAILPALLEFERATIVDMYRALPIVIGHCRIGAYCTVDMQILMVIIRAYLKVTLTAK